MRVRLRSLLGGAAMRTRVIEGECDALPKVGECFEMTGPPLETPEDIQVGDMGARLINTSAVVTITPGGNFITESGSIYHLEVLEYDFDGGVRGKYAPN